MKKLLLSILTLSSFAGFSQWQTTSNNTSGDVFSAFGDVFASDITTTGLYSSADGSTWSSSNTGVPSTGLRFGTLNGTSLYAFGTNTNTIYQSTTGNNWTIMTSAITSADVIKSMTVISGTVLASTCPVSGSGSKIWQLNGTSWALRSSVSSSLIATLRNLNGTLFAGTTGFGVIKSADAGLTFTNSSVGLPTATFMDKYISALGAASSTLFCGSQFGKIYKSVNAGANWTPAYNGSNGSTSNFVNDIYVYLNNYVMAATDSGFIASPDGGATWAKYNTGLTYSNSEYLMKKVTVVGNYIVAAVGTSGPNPRVMRRLISEVFPTIGINENLISAIESNVYPNPANGFVTVAARDLMFENNALVKITDLLGKEIGVYKMNDGKANINLQNFDQGIYTYRVYNENSPVSVGKLIVE